MDPKNRRAGFVVRGQLKPARQGRFKTSHTDRRSSRPSLPARLILGSAGIAVASCGNGINQWRVVKNKMPGGLGFNPLKLPRMVLNPFRNRVQFVVERLLLSGTVARLAVAAAVIGMVAVCMGLLGFLVAANTEQAFGNPAEAVWWAFLRLSDPGYLGDDEGLGLRAVSTVVTVAGCWTRSWARSGRKG
jgi:hypothetical protein